MRAAIYPMRLRFRPSSVAAETLQLSTPTGSLYFYHSTVASLFFQLINMASSVDDERFDGLYMNVAQTARGIEPLLDTVFSFLRRKTDFFAGPPGAENGSQAAIDKVNEVLKRHADLYEQAQKKATTTAASKAQKKKVAKEELEVLEMETDGGFDISSSPATTESSPKAVTEIPKSAPGTQATKDGDEKKAADGGTEKEDVRGPPPLGNGGTVEGKYTWTQTLSEVSVAIPVPDNTRGKDVNVTIGKKHLKVGLKSQTKMFLIDAPLTKAVIIDDSFWTIEDGNRLVINLQKLNQMEWWEGVCEGDATIDVRSIQPETSSLSDLDGETRKTVEKMMYDQRQKALGLPTSDDEDKLRILERFKEQHPEMDFSNAKIS